MNDLSKLLIKLRGSESGRKAAKRAGISHNYLAILEKGFDPQTKAPINPSPETLRSLAKAYDYSYIELMYVAGYVDEAENLALEETELKQEQEYVAGLFEKITDPVEKEKAISYLKFLANSPTDGAKK